MTGPARRLLVTGAGGYVGSALVRRLRAMQTGGSLAIGSLTLVDLRIPDRERLDGVLCIEGSLSDAGVIAEATRDAPDLVFHLAALTSRRCESDLAAALETNLWATVALFEALRANGNGPALVFTSSIAVFGAPLPSRIDDATPQAPTLSYGALKKMVEVLLADYSRRGAIEGLSLRLPSVVARPAQPGAALSAFASDLISAPSRGRSVVCPVSADATIWFLSLPMCVDNLVHAARLLSTRLPEDAIRLAHVRRTHDEHVTHDARAMRAPMPQARAVTLPALRASVAQVVDALARRYGEAVRELVSFEPDASLDAQFGCWPPLETPTADRLGFRHDGDLDTLIERSLQAD